MAFAHKKSDEPALNDGWNYSLIAAKCMMSKVNKGPTWTPESEKSVRKVLPFAIWQGKNTTVS